MRINVTFRHTEPVEELREYVEKRFQKLQKYSDGPMDVNVVLTVEKFRHTAEVVVSGDGIRAAAKEEQGDMNSAIDILSDKIERQLKRFRDKQRDKKAHGAVPPPVSAETDYDDHAEHPVIIVEQMNAKPMSVEEAAKQLQVLGGNFLAFINADTNVTNVIHWRRDGALGLMQP